MDDPVMTNISYFTTAKILDKRSSLFRVQVRARAVMLPAELVKEVPMEGGASARLNSKQHSTD
jgi:hypothetical protein